MHRTTRNSQGHQDTDVVTLNTDLVNQSKFGDFYAKLWVDDGAQRRINVAMALGGLAYELLHG